MEATTAAADPASHPPDPHAHPFAALAPELHPQSALRAAVTRACRVAEPECVPPLVAAARLAPGQVADVHAQATRLAQRLRERGGAGGKEGLVQGLIQEFALSSQEGVALMCLAEALLRIPDNATRDALIRDKIGDANWQSHIGRSPSVFVNAATWGLLLTGKLVSTHTEGGLASALSRVLAKGGEPIVRRGVDMAMRLMGEQFVTGETIAEALANAKKHEAEGFRHSYDMLGEAALTEDDAQRYRALYVDAIHAIGVASAGSGIYVGPGISIKLSALHPRYSRAQYARVMDELYPRLRELALLARRYDIGLNIDAEEADRLELSLDLLQRLCREPALDGWNGIGFVIQAYQKRCSFVIDELVDLALRTRRRLMVRLVKGAYWDSEIKRAQVDGLEGYPVFTRKAYTDVSFLACARKLLAVPGAIYPQFATHNAHTLAAIHAMAGHNYYPGQYEFQCLYGMGEPLYEQVVAPKSAGGLARPCRIYAPVGTHETLLAYLVRRLLENGANTSFVNRIADATIPIDALVADPVDTVEQIAAETGIIGAPHPRIALPRALFGDARVNSAGVDLADEQRLWLLARRMLDAPLRWHAAPLIDGVERDGAASLLRNPGDRRMIVGDVVEASADDVADALAAAAQGAPAWGAVVASERAATLLRAADLMEADMDRLIGLIVHEAGKTYANAVGEVREAVDFLRYYATQARAELGDARHEPLGVVVCISPWNFPLSIFTGQVAAALAAGNAVIAKPAEQTPLIAAQAVKLLLAGGVATGALQLLPGRGESVGAALVADARVRGVLFTGSNAVARLLQQSLAARVDASARLPTLIAETGGQNAMIVDSSALTEQVVNDAVASAFDSAGQRCSALRVLCVQDDVAERVLAMLRGAMQELRVGATAGLAVDAGPVIDAEALASIESHIDKMRRAGRQIWQTPVADGDALRHGTFVPPTLIELERIGELDREVFGPVLHMVRYRRETLGELVDAINATGFGLTLGVHSRIDETIDFVVTHARVGNIYVNRNMIGAVVGVQPFGGEGLSGTGPKAGGPLYLRRLLVTPSEASPVAAERDALSSAAPRTAIDPGLQLLRDWLACDVSLAAALPRPGPLLHAAERSQAAKLRATSASPTKRESDQGEGRDAGLVAAVDALARASGERVPQLLRGPTGERNTYGLFPRRAVLCVADDRGDLLLQLAAVIAAGSHAVWIDAPLTRDVHREMPPGLRDRVTFGDVATGTFGAALVAARADAVARLGAELALRDGPIVGLQVATPGARAARTYSLDSLQVERSISVNTAAAGGNASLMTIG